MRWRELGQAILAVAKWPSKQELGLQHTTVLPFAISEDWSTLGPFQVGTREAVWGADPLARFGGFHNLVEDERTFASSLAFNGTVSWSSSKAAVTELPQQEFSADLDISFPGVDWDLLQQAYGWSALQWQGWTRGKLVVTSDQPVLIWMHLKQVLEFWIDDDYYFGGDIYGFNRAPTTLSLSPGEHTIELRVIRDVRAMGGITDNPNVNVNVHISATHGALRRSTDVLLPDRLNNELGPTSSTFATVVLRNDDNKDIYISSLEATHDICKAELVQPAPVRLVPGQSRPIGFRVSCIPGTSAVSSIRLFFHYYDGDNPDRKRALFAWGLPRRPQPQSEPHLFTYQHASGIVSYAVIKPPLVNICPPNATLPVVLLLHGAGINADDDLVKHSLDDLPPLCAWTIFPSGVTSWAGDDWHDWGWADVQAAIQAIPAWIEQVSWEGPGVDVDKWLISGHSNGGQGTWHALTHFPDKIMAAAPVSGYSSIQNYVPYSLWHVADPWIRLVLETGLSSHQNELLVGNAANIPVLIQHGSADDNVPSYHSRLMHSRLQELGIRSTLVELADRPHWWDGVMTTPALTDFFVEHLSSCGTAKSIITLHNFTLVSTNVATIGSKGGITIRDLKQPGRAGRAVFSISAVGECVIKTDNVKSLEVSAVIPTACRSLRLDQTVLTIQSAFNVSRSDRNEDWTIRSASSDSCSRSSAQQGGLEAILRSKGTIQLVKHSQGLEHVALQIANNLCQYFGADVAVVDSYADALASSGAVISIATGDDLPATQHECDPKCAVTADKASLTISSANGATHSYKSHGDGLAAAAFLRALPEDRLELMLWATNHDHIDIAARMVPLVTGSGHPDFVVASTKMSYEGVGGALSMGFFDSEWCAASSSYFS